METKRLEMMVKKEELMIKKREKMLLEEMMKNPNMHPAFNYPESKKTVPILKVRQKLNSKHFALVALQSCFKTSKLGIVLKCLFNIVNFTLNRILIKNNKIYY